MKMKILILLSLFIFLQASTGCTTKRDIETLVVVTAIGVDKGTDGNIKVSVQILNPNTATRNPKDVSPVILLSAEGSTMLETLRKIAQLTSGKLVLFQFQVLLFGEELAKEGLEPYAHFFFTDDETQHQFPIAIVQGETAYNVMKIHMPLYTIPSTGISEKIISSNKYYGASVTFTDLDLILALRSSEADFAMPSIKLIGDIEEGNKGDSIHTIEPVANVTSSTYSIFKEKKLIGFLTEEESIAYNYLMGYINESVVSLVMDEGYKINVDINRASVNMSSEIVNNLPKITFHVSASGFIGENWTGYTQTELDFVRKVEAKLKEKLTQSLLACIKKMQEEFNSDIFYISDHLHKHHPMYWKTIKTNYDSMFSSIAIEVDTKTSILMVRY